MPQGPPSEVVPGRVLWSSTGPFGGPVESPETRRQGADRSPRSSTGRGPLPPPTRTLTPRPVPRGVPRREVGRERPEPTLLHWVPLSFHNRNFQTLYLLRRDETPLPPPRRTEKVPAFWLDDDPGPCPRALKDPE